MSRVRNFVLLGVKAVVCLIIGFSVLCVFWIIEPPPSVTYERTTLTPEVEPGEIFRLRISVVWSKTCWSKVYRTFVDGGGQITHYEGEPRQNIKGKRDFVVEAVIPLDAIPGDAQWKVRTDWYCNPWQWQFPKSVDLEPINFKITPHREGVFNGSQYHLKSSCSHYICSAADMVGGKGPHR